mmetsp:Transcript_27355/g.33132  ORF Transcript_27355/g.33132 Transcript_27355/m.33132 type:complete len:223 (-) Transcript_27355:212-880(-)
MLVIPPPRAMSILRQVSTVRNNVIFAVSLPRASFSTVPGAHSNAEEIEANDNNAKVQDYFKILDIKRSFDVSQSELKAKYKNLMAGLHPDRHAAKSIEERNQLHSDASDVTQAYDVILRPHTRAGHILELEGSGLTENDSGHLVGNDFLMAIMEIREEIDEATSDKELNVLLKENNRQIDRLCLDLAEAFKHDMENAKRMTARLQYLVRIEETIRERLSDVE